MTDDPAALGWGVCLFALMFATLAEAADRLARSRRPARRRRAADSARGERRCGVKPKHRVEQGAALNRPRYQTASQASPQRNDHVWARYEDHWKCCLCGAVSKGLPPPFPTPDEWMPERYEALTEAERALVPAGPPPQPRLRPQP